MNPKYLLIDAIETKLHQLLIAHVQQKCISPLFLLITVRIQARIQVAHPKINDAQNYLIAEKTVLNFGEIDI